MTWAEWLTLSAERDLWLCRLLAAEREAYERGRACGVEEGRQVALAEEAAQRREAAALLGRADPGSPNRSWSVRGEPRTRTIFGQPHPADYPGQRVA